MEEDTLENNLSPQLVTYSQADQRIEQHSMLKDKISAKECGMLDLSFMLYTFLIVLWDFGARRAVYKLSSSVI